MLEGKLERNNQTSDFINWKLFVLIFSFKKKIKSIRAFYTTQQNTNFNILPWKENKFWFIKQKYDRMNETTKDDHLKAFHQEQNNTLCVNNVTSLSYEDPFVIFK